MATYTGTPRSFTNLINLWVAMRFKHFVWGEVGHSAPINMPRNYERKTNMGMVDQGVMLRAVNAVIDGKSIRKVAEEKGILKRYVKQYI